MNLGQIESMLYDQFGFRSAPPAEVTTRIRRMINEANHAILGTRGLSRLRRSVVPLASVANGATSVLPTAASNLYTITDRVNNWVLDALTMEDIRAGNPGLLYTSSYPVGYAIMSLAAASALDPSAAAQIWAKSDDAGDGATKTVRIEGLVTGGYFQTASVALNGLTAVQLGSLATWLEITKFYIAPSSGVTVPTATGNITLMQDSGTGTELARIAPGRTYSRYSKIHWHYVPTQANTYYADIDRHIEDMSSVADESFIPEEYHYLLRVRAAMSEYQRRGKMADYGAEKSEFREGLDRLKAYARRMGGVGRSKNPRDRFSQLGPWYPAGS